MNKILIEIGSFSIVLLVIYAIKKINDYSHSKKEGNKTYKFDKDDD